MHYDQLVVIMITVRDWPDYLSWDSVSLHLMASHPTAGWPRLSFVAMAASKLRPRLKIGMMPLLPHAIGQSKSGIGLGPR